MSQQLKNISINEPQKGLMMNKIRYGIISIVIGACLISTNAAVLNSVKLLDGEISAGSYFGLVTAFMLIAMGIWDFIDHYAEVSAKAEMYDKDK